MPPTTTASPPPSSTSLLDDGSATNTAHVDYSTFAYRPPSTDEFLAERFYRLHLLGGAEIREDALGKRSQHRIWCGHEYTYPFLPRFLLIGRNQLAGVLQIGCIIVHVYRVISSRAPVSGGVDR
jgi:hypothetical protein